MTETKQITHKPPLKEQMKTLAAARKILADGGNHLENYDDVLGRARDRLLMCSGNFGDLYVEVWQGNQKIPKKVNDVITPVLDEINRLI